MKPCIVHSLSADFFGAQKGSKAEINLQVNNYNAFTLFTLAYDDSKNLNFCWGKSAVFYGGAFILPFIITLILNIYIIL
jgi:hypothetical protein